MISIRAHHGMCFAFFQGKGYSNGFTAHMTEVQMQLAQNPMVEVINSGDLVCEKCPNFSGHICDTPKKVQRYDDQVLSLCALTPGTQLPWMEFSQLVQENILRPGKREEICGDCQWSSLCK